MSSSELIDRKKIREAFTARRKDLAQSAEPPVFTLRASIKVVHNLLKEARTGKFHFRSDELEMLGGEGEAPMPLQYFLAAVGF